MWSGIFAFLMQVVSFILNRITDNEETKKKFFDFIRQAANDTKSTKLMKWGEEQLAYLEKTPWKSSKPNKPQ